MDAAPSIARVEPILTARRVRGPFDYRIPDGMAGIGVGSLLLVPFGRRRVIGVVVEIADRSELPLERLAEPIEALEAGAPAELVRLGLWVAREYCSTPARGLGLVLPPDAAAGKRPRLGAPRTERRARIAEPGRRALAGLSGERCESRLGSRQLATLTALASGEELSAAEVRVTGGGDAAVLRRLAERGLVELRDAPRDARPRVEVVGDRRGAVELSSLQRACVARLEASLDGEGPRERLLYGVTGSGKTEVYLAAIEAALARGKGAILLVPEIALTPQTLGRVRARLGERAALLHSGLAEGERGSEWRRLRSGEARVCVGPRSAAFAPVPDLGLLVVDEEHDPSYKQEGDPRYDARRVAIRRASEAAAVYLAGSATPRPESWAGLDRLELPERIDGRALPEVAVLDMREAAPRAGPLHPEARAALVALAADGGKAIVMLNRRGYSPFLACEACGQAVGCPSCDVSLVLHREAGRLACHHCGHLAEVPTACGSCGSVAIARHGAGTERLERLVGELVDPLPVFRLDADTVRRRGAHARVLGAFDRAQAGVLIGTQMVAKGHDFGAVTLSLLVDADSALRFPDFRAEERTFALVAQLAGRSGRGERGGRVLVQTLAPDAAPIRAAAAHDAPGFLAAELERRRAFGYPPYRSLLALELASADGRRLVEAAGGLAERLGGLLPAGAELLGPAPRFRRRGRYRRRLLVKADDRESALAAVREAVEAAVGSGEIDGIALAVDVDPQ